MSKRVTDMCLVNPSKRWRYRLITSHFITHWLKCGRTYVFLDIPQFSLNLLLTILLGCRQLVLNQFILLRLTNFVHGTLSFQDSIIQLILG